MSTLLRRPILAFLLGAALLGAAAAGTAAYAALTDDRVAACYVPKSGALYVVGRDGAPSRCADGHLPIDWSVRGPQGPAGVFSGTFTSPNGAYAISVTDTGIVLSGPGSAVRLTGANVAVESAGDLTISTSGATSVHGAGDVTIEAGRRATLKGTTAAVVESSGPVTVNGTTSATVQSAGVTLIKGAIVQANSTVLP